MSKLTINELEEVSRLYKTGMYVKDIAALKGVSMSSIYNYLREYGTEADRKILPDIKEVLDLFDNKRLSLNKIAKVLNVDRNTISKLLIQEGRDTQNTTRKCAVWFNPFEDMTDPNVQYWLGYLCSDGNVYKNSIKIYTNIDRDHLDKYKKFIGVDLHIQSHLNKHNTIDYCAAFRNKEVFEYLNLLGIVPNKSKILKVNFPITFAFLRGIWDGDGCVSKDKHTRCISSSMVTASEQFSKQVCQFLMDNSIEFSCIFRSPCWNIRIKNRGGSLRRFYKLLYAEGSYWLSRKKDKYLLGNDIV